MREFRIIDHTEKVGEAVWSDTSESQGGSHLGMQKGRVSDKFLHGRR